MELDHWSITDYLTTLQCIIYTKMIGMHTLLHYMCNMKYLCLLLNSVNSLIATTLHKIRHTYWNLWSSVYLFDGSWPFYFLFFILQWVLACSLFCFHLASSIFMQNRIKQATPLFFYPKKNVFSPPHSQHQTKWKTVRQNYINKTSGFSVLIFE